VRIPGLLNRAASSGDLSELATLTLDYQRAFNEGVDWASGLWLSVSCSEDGHRISEGEMRAESDGTVFGDYRIRAHVAACQRWPKGELPPGYNEQVRSDKPVLIFSGLYDPVTPPRNGAAVANHLPNSLHVIPAEGHGPTNNVCSSQVIAEFYELGTTEGLDVSCLEAVELPPWELPRRKIPLFSKD
jgi:pimeloyl-ACP methyl ester carboxylesterase